MGDIRYAWRSLRRDWGFALTFVLTLGLGIGANTAIFSLVNGVLLRPLPYPDADRIVRVAQPAAGIGVADLGFSFEEVADLRDQVSALEEVVEYGDWVFSVLGRGDPHRVVAGLVTANFFEVLGMRPLHGRLLEDSDRQRNSAPVVVLSHEYWQRSFGADPAVVGQMLDLTATTATIVGVLEPGVHYATARELDLYANYSTNDHYSGAAMEEDRGHRMTTVFARIAPGVTLGAAQDEATRAASRLHQIYPEAYPADMDFGLRLTPWRDELVVGARQTLLILLGTALSVLMIACANVANLTLTRLVRRDREIAVRRALGAGTGRLRRLLVTESIMLAGAGAVLGLFIAYVGMDGLTRYTGRFTSRTGEIGIDLTVLLFTLTVALVVALLFGLVPAAGAESRLAESLSAGGGHATAGRQRRLVQRLLVVAQVAICFILLVGTGLLLRTLANLYAVDPGYDLANVLSLEAPSFGDFSIEQEQQFSRDVEAQVATQPGVASVALVASTPLSGTQAFPMSFRTDSTPEDSRIPVLPTVFLAVTPQYFDTLGIELRRGRFITAADQEDSQPVAVLSAAMAQHYFGDEDPVGRQIAYSFGGDGFSDWYTVVGVVGDARMTSVTDDAHHAYYLAQYQNFPGASVLVRSEGRAAAVTAEIVETIRALDPDRPIENITTLAELRDDMIAPQRLNAILFGGFAGLALAIALVGIAGVLAFSVSQRRREMGIRVALGADRRGVVDLILREGALLTIGGVVAGLFGAIFLARSLAGLLYGVEPSDPGTFVAVAFVLIAAGLVGAWIPARRAASVDPIEALRSD
jgi:predicted permease